MRELLFFAIGAGISGSILLVSAVELYLAIKRRKQVEALEQQLTRLKGSVNEQVNKLTLEKDKLAEERSESEAALAEQLKTETAAIEEKYEKKFEKLQTKNEQALKAAKAEAKELEEHAEQQAEAYLEKRKAEVEEELVDLVVDVSKRVLPKGISYQAQKELVMHALRDLPEHER